ncbi:uncharacterized protein Dana_GF10084 [Drosophila ananassae]|uniref:Ig-like domain-containing protein n=1 Tax=Drosophila ananassae TaxID=7217 RepID=B3M5E6_DROAN|nr:uncharacterized protein LOC6492959 [Drosophila ananassae]EDV39556.2 uncharacterized protein Dana_GF10084 [Drosophila ananassae]
MRLNEPAEKTRPRKNLTTKPNQSSSVLSGDSSPARRYHHRQHRQHIECSIRNLVGLVLLTATIMCSGFVRAKTIYDSVNRIPDLPPDAVTPKTPMRTTASVGSFASTATPTHTATPIVFSTLRNSYADATSQAIEEDSDSDSDSDADVDDYVIDESSTVAAAILEQGNPVKSQDLESLSLQSAASETVASKTSPEELLRKSSFQQLGSQKVNALVPATVATTHSEVPSHASAMAPTEPARNRSGVVRNSAVKVDGKHPISKGQKTDAPMLNYIFDTFSSANKHHHHDQRYGPHFEDVQRVGQITNLTVQAGSSIHLNCRISLLQDKTVSWVRHNTVEEDNALDLLTVGMHTYTGDKRYKMEFQYPNNWRLKITNVKKDDEAMYECQISTHPPRVIQINLHVNAPKVMIVDEVGDPLQEKYYEIDSTLQLSCVVRNVAMTSSVVLWKHAEDILNYDVTRGGVSVKTELMEDGANSTLSIAKISKTDSGNYTCSISEFQNFTIVVHILNGESFAELHHGGAGVVRTMRWQLVALQLLALLLLTTATSLRGKFS